MATKKNFGEGDTYLVENLLPGDAVAIFEKLKDEVQWQTMYHHGMLPHVLPFKLNFDAQGLL